MNRRERVRVWVLMLVRMLLVLLVLVLVLVMRVVILHGCVRLLLMVSSIGFLMLRRPLWRRLLLLLMVRGRRRGSRVRLIGRARGIGLIGRRRRWMGGCARWWQRIGNCTMRARQ
jgi:hypothetical protein